MGYRKTDNLYANQDILLFDECYAMEKIHGTSTHLKFTEAGVTVFSGGIKHELFSAIFDLPALHQRWKNLKLPNLIVYGEGYGGSCQKMSETYGKETRFVAFEVLVLGEGEGTWQTVSRAHEIAALLCLEFVDYVRIPTKLSLIDAERDRESVQAIRNGCGPGKTREGVVLRTINEERDKRGNRIMAKHKCAAFSEHSKPREVDPSKAEKVRDAQVIAEDWVTEMRLTHVMDAVLGSETPTLARTGDIVRGMIADIRAEGEKEIEFSKEVDRAIGTRAAQLYKRYLGVPS